MAFVLDLNEMKRTTMTLVMKDDNKTVVHLCCPNRGTVTKIQQTLPDLQRALSGEGAEASRAVYELAADLINNNLDNFKTTADELLRVYEMNLEDMAVFYTSYVDFISYFEKAKN